MDEKKITLPVETLHGWYNDLTQAAALVRAANGLDGKNDDAAILSVIGLTKAQELLESMLSGMINTQEGQS